MIFSKLRTLACINALAVLTGPLAIADDLTQTGQITIDPPVSPAILTLMGLRSDPDSSDPYGLSMSYHDDSTGTSTGVFRLYRPAGQYQWQFSTADGDRNAMTLGNDHSLTLFDPLNPLNQLILAPGSITIGGVPVLTAVQAGQTYLAAHPLSFSGGTSTSMLADNSLAIGTGLIATAQNQAVVGRWNRPFGYPNGEAHFNDWLFIVGNGTSDADRSNVLAVGGDGDTFLHGSLSIGDEVHASVKGSIAVGGGTQALAIGAIAVGESAYAMWADSVALGGWVRATTYAAVALGGGSAATGVYSTAIGYGATAPNTFAFAQGEASVASGLGAFAVSSSAALGNYSTSMGLGTKASGYGQMAVGRFNLIQGDLYGWGPPDPAENLFVVGNGSSDTQRSNAFVVKNNGDVSAAGVFRVKPAGDIGMGAFTAGPQP